MDRERFDHLLDAYGGDLARWPAADRASAAAFVARDAAAAEALQHARRLDSALNAARGDEPDTALLAKRILAQAPRGAVWLDRRAMIALAACAAFGVLIGYGGGKFAPAGDADDEYFAAAFEAPFESGDEG